MTIGQLFNPALSDEIKAYVVDRAGKKLTYINDQLLKNGFAAGEEVSIADIYLYITLTWTKYVGLDLTPYPVIAEYVDKMAAHPHVVSGQEAMATSPATTN
jgi:glutathione S-transferase